MDASLPVGLLALLLAAVGCVGIIVPVLPGSLAVAGGLLVWAIWGGSASGWPVFAIGAVLVAAGMSGQYLLTGRTLKRREIPSRSVLIGLVLGVVGLFTIPVVGLPLGFVLGLFGAELVRERDLRRALTTSGIALRAVGIGILVEFGCAALATAALTFSVVTTLLT